MTTSACYIPKLLAVLTARRNALYIVQWWWYVRSTTSLGPRPLRQDLRHR